MAAILAFDLLDSVLVFILLGLISLDVLLHLELHSHAYICAHCTEMSSFAVYVALASYRLACWILTVAPVLCSMEKIS